jgi:hypothetical protein
MEAMGIIGFIFGLAGLSYATTAKKEIANLRQEFQDFKLSVEFRDKINNNSKPE